MRLEKSPILLLSHHSVDDVKMRCAPLLKLQSRGKRPEARSQKLEARSQIASHPANLPSFVKKHPILWTPSGGRFSHDPSPSPSRISKFLPTSVSPSLSSHAVDTDSTGLAPAHRVLPESLSGVVLVSLESKLVLTSLAEVPRAGAI
jgi:hypothetical protein